MAQPIRPAHSIIFIVVAFILVITIIKRLDLSFAIMSGLFVHLSMDTEQFPPFSSVLYGYQEVGSYQAEFVAVAVSALLADYLSRRSR